MSAEKEDSAYRRSGVDIDAQDRALAKVGKLVRSTFSSRVLSEIGSFGGLYQPDLDGLDAPVLVASADGVGTKLMVAKMAGDYSTVGRDLVNHCVNDILVQGARPLFFLDYVGAGVLDPDSMVELVKGVVRGCHENGCALLGGETAEMPGFYQPGDYELVGFIVGLVDRPRVLDGSGIQPRDLLIGLPSAGLHTNGFSLARKVFLEDRGMSLDTPFPSGDKTLRDVLLSPHLSYLKAIEGLLGHPGLRALVHVTGGGLTDNLPRVLPAGLHASIRVGSWSVPEELKCLQRWGRVSDEEMFRVFNMGIGMVVVVAPDSAQDILRHLKQQGAAPCPIGTAQKNGLLRRKEGVVYDFPAADSTAEGSPESEA